MSCALTSAEVSPNSQPKKGSSGVKPLVCHVSSPEGCDSQIPEVGCGKGLLFSSAFLVMVW